MPGQKTSLKFLHNSGQGLTVLVCYQDGHRAGNPACYQMDPPLQEPVPTSRNNSISATGKQPSDPSAPVNHTVASSSSVHATLPFKEKMTPVSLYNGNTPPSTKNAHIRSDSIKSMEDCRQMAFCPASRDIRPVYPSFHLSVLWAEVVSNPRCLSVIHTPFFTLIFISHTTF